MLPTSNIIGNMTSGSVLVLNLSYEALNVCNARRALILLCKGRAELLADGNGEVRSPCATFNVPSVIRLAYLVKRPFGRRKLSKTEIFLRDRHTCQYCGSQVNDLTLDHVVPRRQDGGYSCENIVAACIPYNRRKAAHTAAQAGMSLIRQPKLPYPNPYYILHHRTVMDECRPLFRGPRFSCLQSWW